MPVTNKDADILDSSVALSWRHHVLSTVDTGFGFTDRVISDHVVWVIRGGCVLVSTQDQQWQGGAGGVMWMPPGVKHTVALVQRRSPLRAYSFRFGSDARLWPEDVGPIFIDALVEVGPIAEALYLDCTVADEWSDQRCRCHLYTMLTTLQRYCRHSQDESGQRQGLSYGQRVRLVDYADRHLHMGLEPADLARECHLSLDYFSRKFKQSFAVSPRAWIKERRLQRAASMLQHGHRHIAGLAEALGYNDPNLLSRQFADRFGVPPTRYID